MSVFYPEGFRRAGQGASWAPHVRTYLFSPCEEGPPPDADEVRAVARREADLRPVRGEGRAEGRGEGLERSA